jgi:hypothetical protein
MLNAPSGRMQLASMPSPGQVVFSPLKLAPDMQVGSFARLGRIEFPKVPSWTPAAMGAGWCSSGGAVC